MLGTTGAVLTPVNQEEEVHEPYRAQIKLALPDKKPKLEYSDEHMKKEPEELFHIKFASSDRITHNGRTTRNLSRAYFAAPSPCFGNNQLR